MNLFCKKKRQLTREESPYRDGRLFIVASEDTYIVKAYFALFRQERIKVQVLPTPKDDGVSAPEHVLDRLNNYADEYELEKDDQLWLVLDTDHWTEPNHVANFRQVCSEAIKKGYHLAHSNPCFALWLLLHHEDIDTGKPLPRCALVENLLKERLGRDCKRTLDPKHFSPASVRTAIERAKTRDEGALTDRWPQEPGSHVYKLVQELLWASQWTP